MSQTLAGVLLALGNIVRFAVQGNFVSWSKSLTSCAAVAILGLILLAPGAAGHRQTHHDPRPLPDPGRR